jgi:2'-5' RNA ligase
MGMCSFMEISDDKKALELLENLTEEEEEDDEKSESIKESEFVNHSTIAKIKGDHLSEISLRSYKEYDLGSIKIILEVQTPPPENTMS